MGIFDKMKGPEFIKDDSEAEKELAVLKSLPSTPEIERQIKLTEAGIEGEEQVRFELENSHIPMYVIHDLFLEHDGLTAQIDYMIICHKCTYVVECKNLYGNIEVDDKGGFIRNFNYGKFFKKEGIYSPVTQNQRHLELIRQMIKDRNLIAKLSASMGFDDAWKGVVVLANPKTVLNDKKAPKEIRQQVIRADQLADYIRKNEAESKQPSSSETEMKERAEAWLSRNKPNPVDYTEKYKKAASEQTEEANAETVSAPVCQRCGVPMVKRIAKKGEYAGREFWGCPNFPRCRNMIPIDKA